MTKNAKPAAGMVLPPFNPATGQVDAWAHRWDVRVPDPIERDRPAQPVACHIRTSQCPDGRHLFDAIETTAYETWDEATEKSTQRFRLVLTCVRCGLVEPIEGVQDTTRSRTTRVDPVPLRAGTLRAQQATTAKAWGRDASSYLVHDADGAPVGVIDWARGKRGRAFYTGRLQAWPPGQHVQAPTVAGCLRKLAHAHADHPPAEADRAVRRCVTCGVDYAPVQGHDLHAAAGHDTTGQDRPTTPTATPDTYVVHDDIR